MVRRLSILLMLAAGLMQASTPLTITGTIEERVPDSSGFWPGSFIVLKADNRVIGQAAIDEQGRFTLPCTIAGEKRFDLYYASFFADTLLLFSTAHFSGTQPQLALTLPIEPYKTIFGRAYCPKCERADRVFSIKYGNGPAYVRRITAQGDTVFSPIYKGKHQAGTCLVEPARYYCDRDKVKF